MFSRRATRIAAAVAALALLFVVAWLMPPDGHEQGGWLRLTGRSHPLLVHFPIVLLLLVPVFEWAGRKRPALQEAAGVLLGFAVCTALTAALAGLALMRADGHEGELLSEHRFGGVALAAVTTLAWLFRGWSRAGYALSLVAAFITLFWTAHNGGSLTHGEDYLTAALPPAVKRALHIKETPAPETYGPDTVFGAAVHPVLEKHCLYCHGAEKQKGEYRMETFAALLAGGKSGKAAIVPGDLLHSELVRRLALEPDDEKLMPPRKKPRPTAAEIALLRWWVKAGASRELRLDAVKDAPREVAALLSSGPVKGDPAAAPTYVPRVGDYSILHGEITRLEQSLGIRLVPVSRQAGDGLILRVRGAEARFGDAELAQLARVAPFIVDAELAGTRVTDAGFASLKPFANLARLHLERTAVNGSGLGALLALPKLEYLNLCTTNVSDETLPGLTPHPGLRQVFLFGSKVTAAGVARVQSSLPQVRFGPLEASP